MKHKTKIICVVILLLYFFDKATRGAERFEESHNTVDNVSIMNTNASAVI